MEKESMLKKRYWGKLLLFGEYSMIFDSNALVIPMKQFCAVWAQGEDEFLRFSRQELQQYVRFLSEDPLLAEKLDTNAFAEDLENGWALASAIPIGYGLGSSGTVVAAVYDRYARERIADPIKLRKLFAQMEGYFHGSSSGIDPLQCYLGKPFRISADSLQILPEDFLQKGIYIGLLDTKIKSDTKPLVEGFRKQREDPAFLREFERDYLPYVETCMDMLIQGNKQSFFPALQELRQTQLHFFRKMIPNCVLPLFHEPPYAGLGIKILGSGGGGYMLVFADDAVAAAKYLDGNDILWLQ